ncbi:MAG TPA: hypothetical protein DDW20_04685 [Firmicutes bacterium]|nr:hypothetical protein [Bacillota bacterium]
MLDTILSFVLFVISLSALIVIHELGHFLTAKAFNVYCQEFSIGFGPALIHKRKKGKETYFSLRAVPLGGYVSMYGEGVELEDGVVVPNERSIDGIKRYKKAVVLSAGIILNAVLALTLFSISNLCFPEVRPSNYVVINENSTLYNQGLRNDDRLSFITNKDGDAHFYNEYNDENGTTRAAGFYIVDDDVSFNEGKYVLTFYPNGNKNDTIFTDAFYLFPADKTEGIEQTDVWSKWELKNYPDYKNGYYQLKEKDISFTTNLKFYVNDGIDENGEIRYVIKDFPTEIKSIEVSENNIKWQDIGLSFKTIKTWLPFGDRIVGTFEDFGNASVAIIQGIGSLFTGGIKNMSGIVGIFSTSSQIYSQFTFSYYLYFWGLISVNLAIFNLLPFPGLDGWQLLVTAIEGSVNAFKRHKYKRLNGGFVNGFQEWKIPNKIKNIVSFIGLGLLFVLMIAILIMDIIRLF